MSRILTAVAFALVASALNVGFAISEETEKFGPAVNGLALHIEAGPVFKRSDTWMPLTASLRNDGAEPVIVYPATRGHFELRVLNEKGREMPQKFWFSPSAPAYGEVDYVKEYTIAPGEMKEDSMAYQLGNFQLPPGKYRVTATASIYPFVLSTIPASQTPPVAIATLTSNTIEVTVE